MKVTQSKVNKVKAHLEKYGSITGGEAWRLYSLYRLSAAIYVLRHEHNMDIAMEMVDGVDAQGDRVRFGRYLYAKQQ